MRGLVLMEDNSILKVACQTEYYLDIKKFSACCRSVGTSGFNPVNFYGLVSK